MNQTTTIMSSLLGFILSQPCIAVPDLYEPNDTPAQAYRLFPRDPTPHQYTLHTIEDRDWFVFYAAAGTRYDITVNNVGIDVDVMLGLYETNGNTLIRESNDGLNGGNETLSWRIQTEGLYYIKISNTDTSTAICRANTQYQLEVTDSIAPTLPAVITGLITDSLSGNGLKCKAVFSSWKENNRIPCTSSGHYAIDGPPQFGLGSLTVEVEGYLSSTCQFPIPELLKVEGRNIPVWHDEQRVNETLGNQLSFRNGDTLRPSRYSDHDGEKLKVEFVLHELPPPICSRYYVGISYPDGNLHIVSALNQIKPFNPDSLPFWNDNGITVIDKPITEMQRGHYYFYLLRLPANIKNPMDYLEAGELNVAEFQID